MDELKSLGVLQSFALVDSGYCSEKNLKMLREHKIDFLTRLPAGRSLYKTMLINHAHSMEDIQNLITFGSRTLFVKLFTVEDLYGEIVFIEIREKLKGKFTVEQAFMILRTLKCKIYENTRIFQELTKKQKQIFELNSILVPDLNQGI